MSFFSLGLALFHDINQTRLNNYCSRLKNIFFYLEPLLINIIFYSVLFSEVIDKTRINNYCS